MAYTEYLLGYALREFTDALYQQTKIATYRCLVKPCGA